MINSPVDGATLKMQTRIGYRELSDGKNDWKELASSLEERKLNCKLPEVRFFLYKYIKSVCFFLIMKVL